MTKFSTRELVCPECNSEQEFTIYDSVNVTLDPNAKEKLINGELNIFSCDTCGYKVEIVYPMLYHDMDGKLMIWLDPEDRLDPDKLGEKQPHFGTFLDESYHYRIVSTRNEMMEKILIFDNELDDLPLELLKYYIRQTHLGKDDDPDETVLFFGGRDLIENEGEVILINKLSGPDKKSFRVPISKYLQIKDGYTDYYPDPMPEASRWLRVDENYFK